MIEQNLVVCEWCHSAGVRLGLSLGGGMGKRFCVNQGCKVELTNRVIRNNTILNCPHDMGIHLSGASDAKYTIICRLTRFLALMYALTPAGQISVILPFQALSETVRLVSKI